MLSLSRTKCKQKRASPSRESPLAPTRFATAFANLLLAASSGWALRQTGGLGLGLSLSTLSPSRAAASASAATFTLFLIHSLVGIIRFGNPQYGDALRSSYENTAYLCVVLALPCFAAQFATMYSFPQKITMSLIVFASTVAVWNYISRLCSGNKSSEARWATSKSVRFVVAVSLIFIVFISYQKLNYYGVAAALAFSLNFFFTGPTGTVFNLPAIDLFLYQLTFFNAFAVKALLD